MGAEAVNAAQAENLIVTFNQLFAGRRDVWGAVYGECRREPLTHNLWREHLFGAGSIGVYPLVNGNVAWGCSDIDSGYEAIGAAVNLHAALRELGIVSWVEITKGKGYHTFVFSDSWVSAETMRRALLLAHQIAEVPPKEVNPKQTGDTPKGLGNYVNCPYSRDWVAQGKRVVLDMQGDRQPITARRFAEAAYACRVPRSLIEEAARLYKPPEPHKHTANANAGPAVLRGRTKTLFENGPTEGRDRSSTLFLLVRWLEVDGFSAEQALPLLRDLDQRLQKYCVRHDAEERYAEIINEVYS